MLKGLDYRFKYIVPFMHYTQSQDISSYELINKTLSKNGEWTPSSAKTRQEQDIYHYVLDSMDGAKNHNSTDGDKDNCICSVWKKTIIEKAYCKYIKNANNKKIIIDFGIKNVEMFVFRNHVGMICYEIDFHDKDAISKLSLEDICEFQNAFIEFGRNNRDLFDLLFENEYDKNVMLSPPSSRKERDKIESDHKERKLIKMINMESGKAKYITPAALIPDDIYNQPAVNSYYVVEKAVPGQAEKTRLEVYRRLNVGRWINSMLYCLSKEQDLQIEYYSPKTIPGNIIIPDKAIVYSCAMVEDEFDQQVVREVSYKLANGYPFKHNASTDPAEYWEHTTGVLWYASRQGCGRTVQKSCQYSSVFESVLKSLENDDYFLIYLLELNQLFGLTYYDKMVTKKLTQDIREYTKENRPLQNELLQTQAEINLFLMKSSFAGISNIQKQNEFYSYVKKQLELDESKASIQSGLDGLNALQESLAQKNRERSEERLNISLGILAMLAVISALSDAKVLFWDSDPGKALNNLAQHPLFVVSSIVIVIMAIIAFINIIRCIVESRRERNK